MRRLLFSRSRTSARRGYYDKHMTACLSFCNASKG